MALVVVLLLSWQLEAAAPRTGGCPGLAWDCCLLPASFTPAVSSTQRPPLGCGLLASCSPPSAPKPTSTRHCALSVLL